MKLGDIFKISSGGTPDKKKKIYYENGTIPWIKTGDLKEKFVSNDVEQITLQGLNNCSAKLFPAGTVLVAMYGATIGACSILNYQASTNQACAAFLPNPQVLPDYLYYFLSSRKNLFIQNGVGGAQPNISATYLKTVPFKYVPIDVQIHIITVLDKLTTLISLRKQQLAKLDELVKARFVEMFGDPIKNPMNWNEVCIKNVCQSIYGGGTPSKNRPEFFSGKIPWVSPKDLKSLIIEDSIDHITEDAIKQSSTNLVPKNSVLMVIRSGILKHSLPVAINIVPVTINQDMKAFIPNESISAEYLLYYFKLIEKDILTKVRSVTADNIDFKDFLKRMIPVPHARLQLYFSDFVNQVFRCSLIVQQSIDKMEVLKKSLMQNFLGSGAK